MQAKSSLKKRFWNVVIWALIIALIAPLLIPYPPIPGVTDPQQFADSDSQFIEVNGITLHHKTYGQGNPVFILLHGTLANTYTWQKVVGPLSKLGTVIAYDRPPFGLSSRPMPGEWKGTSPYSYESQTDLLVGLMDALHIQKAILIGNSMGGAIAAYTAQRYPSRVAGLVLIDPAQTAHGVPNQIRWLLAAPQLRKIGPLFVRSQVRKFATNLYMQSWHDPSKIQQEDWNAYLTIFQIQNWDRALWELLVAARPFETILDFEAIKTPILLITGDDDRVVGTQANRQLARKISNANLVVIPNCGHVPQEECPTMVIDAVDQWLDQQH